MIEHVWSVLCTTSIIDQETNNISLINVLEQLTIPADVELPVVSGNPFALITLWARRDFDRPASAKARVVSLHPSGKTVTLSEYEIDLSSHSRIRSRLNFYGLQITGPGKHVFQVELQYSEDDVGFEVVARLPVEIQIISPEITTQ